MSNEVQTEAPEETREEGQNQQKRNEIKPADFYQLEDSQEQKSISNNIERILDVPVTISAELGRTRMVINDLLQLGQGSVIELDKLAGEPLEVLVNDRLIARGEVVVVNEKFGIRLTDIISPLERIKQLRK